MKEHDVTELLCAALEYLESEISRVYWNKHQKEWESAFRNTGNSYKSKSFSVDAYNWGEEKDGSFKWRDIEINWYKNLGRGTYANRDITPTEISEMLDDCLNNISEDEQGER